ncbi:hypothetical protein DOJK_02082 [Patescibacteria group bacterium]|nr:hypothetical protein DOJK_02082 [Patescibacteria group bacterium]
MLVFVKNNKNSLMAVGLGILMGLLSSSYILLPSPFTYFFSGFFNTASVWILFTFWFGTRFKSKIKAFVLPVSSLVLSIVVYYLIYSSVGAAPLLGVNLATTVIGWGLISIILGGIGGLSGRMAEFAKKANLKVFAVIIPLIIVFTENIANLIQIIPYLSISYINLFPFFFSLALIVLALSTPFILFRKNKLSVYIVAISVVLAVIGVFVLNLMYSLI